MTKRTAYELFACGVQRCCRLRLHALSLCAVGAVAAVLLVACTPAAGGGENATDALSDGTVFTVTAEEARAMMVSDQDVVIDVRSQEEYDASHIANARLLPVEEICEKSAVEIAPDKDRPVFVYCRTGVRSAQAAKMLAALGYVEVYDFGGILSWPYGTIDAQDDAGAGTFENDELPVGVKVVCGKTRALPDGEDAEETP